MKQVFVSGPLSRGMTLSLDEKTAHHIFDVLRTAPKEKIRIVDENGRIFYGHTLNKPDLQIDEQDENTLSRQNPDSKPELTLCAALIKADRFEWMLQKAAELGAERIVPFTCRNTVVSIEEKKIDRKMERWNSILESACRQSNRTSLVKLEKPCSISQLGKWKSALNLMAWEKEKGSHHLACELGGLSDSATFVIGPEGGFTLQEAAFLEEEGFVPVSLGPRILRAETAACYVLGAADAFAALKGCPLSEQQEEMKGRGHRSARESGEGND